MYIVYNSDFAIVSYGDTRREAWRGVDNGVITLAMLDELNEAETTQALTDLIEEQGEDARFDINDDGVADLDPTAP